jgi:hypothetical protein
MLLRFSLATLVMVATNGLHHRHYAGLALLFGMWLRGSPRARGWPRCRA